MLTPAFGRAVNGLRMGVAAERAQFRAGSSADIWIVVENVSTNMITYAEHRPYRDYDARVTGPAGAAARTAEGRAMESEVFQELPSEQRVRLAPGASRQLRFPLSRLFDVSSAGDYSIEVVRPDWNDAQGPLTAPAFRLRVR